MDHPEIQRTIDLLSAYGDMGAGQLAILALLIIIFLAFLVWLNKKTGVEDGRICETLDEYLDRQY